MSKKTNKPKRKPPSTAISSPQFDLFTSFLSNHEEDVSNTIEIWEAIPKYFFTPAQLKKLRTPQGHADPHKWSYTFNGQPCQVEIQPALLEQSDGRYLAFFPGATEELVEEALKKIFTDQTHGIHDPQKEESWVRFTLRIISKELKARGRERNLKEIKQAIKIMNRCHLTLYQGGKEVYSGAILSDLVTVNREEYLEDSGALHAARLPVFLSHAINRLEYRQFNYATLMECDEQLTRWLYRRLVHRYRQASLIDAYHFNYSDVKQGSGLLQQGTESRNRDKMISALNELKDRDVLLNYTAEPRKNGRQIIGVKYTVYATREFMKDQKAANKRASKNDSNAQKLRLVDKSS